MSEQWTHDTGDRVEEVIVTQQPGHEQRQEIVTDVAAARNEVINKVTQLIWLLLFLLEALIALRIVLKLIAANPASPFAALIYNMSDLFLWPFFGLTNSPAAAGMVLEVPSIIAMAVYALIAAAVVKVIWLIFSRRPTQSVSTYQRDQTRRG
jgi:hypothetical protein